MDSEVNHLNQLVTKLFTKAMNDIFEVDSKDKDYELQRENWIKQFRFPLAARNYFNDLNNIIVLGGNSNSSLDTQVDRSILEKLEFDREVLNLLTEKIDNKEKWMESFAYTFELENFKKRLRLDLFNEDEDIKNKISFSEYKKYRDEFIFKLEQAEDETIKLLSLMDTEIGEQKYEVSLNEIKKEAKVQAEKIIKKIREKGEQIDESKVKETIKVFKENELEVNAEKKIVQKKYEKFDAKNGYNLDDVIKQGAAELKKYPKVMDTIAGVGIAGVLVLMILSVTCPGCGSEGFFAQNQDILSKISEFTSGVTIENKTVFGPSGELQSIEVTEIVSPAEAQEIRIPTERF